MQEHTDPIALADQAVEEVKQQARVVAAYFLKLVEEGVGVYEATRLTLAFQRRLLFHEQRDLVDSDDD